MNDRSADTSVRRADSPTGRSGANRSGYDSASRLASVPQASRADVHELLDHLDRGPGCEHAVGDSVDEPAAWLAQRMVRTGGVNKNGRVQDDHLRSPRRSPSSVSRAGTSGTAIGSADKIASPAARR